MKINKKLKLKNLNELMWEDKNQNKIINNNDKSPKNSNQLNEVRIYSK